MYNPLLGLHGSRTPNRVLLCYLPLGIHKLSITFRVLHFEPRVFNTIWQLPTHMHVYT